MKVKLWNKIWQSNLPTRVNPVQKPMRTGQYGGGEEQERAGEERHCWCGDFELWGGYMESGWGWQWRGPIYVIWYRRAPLSYGHFTSLCSSQEPWKDVNESFFLLIFFLLLSLPFAIYVGGSPKYEFGKIVWQIFFLTTVMRSLGLQSLIFQICQIKYLA